MRTIFTLSDVSDSSPPSAWDDSEVETPPTDVRVTDPKLEVSVWSHAELRTSPSLTTVTSTGQATRMRVYLVPESCSAICAKNSSTLPDVASK